MSLTNRIKTDNYIVSSDEILAIKKLLDKNNVFYGIIIYFHYGSTMRICNKNEALKIINIYDEPEE